LVPRHRAADIKDSPLSVTTHNPHKIRSFSCIRLLYQGTHTFFCHAGALRGCANWSVN